MLEAFTCVNYGEARSPRGQRSGALMCCMLRRQLCALISSSNESWALHEMWIVCCGRMSHASLAILASGRPSQQRTMTACCQIRPLLQQPPLPRMTKEVLQKTLRMLRMEWRTMGTTLKEMTVRAHPLSRPGMSSALDKQTVSMEQMCAPDKRHEAITAALLNPSPHVCHVSTVYASLSFLMQQ